MPHCPTCTPLWSVPQLRSGPTRLMLSAGLIIGSSINLPSLVFEAFTALLNDPYIAVHQQAVRGLRRLWSLPDDYRPGAKRALLGWTIAYSSSDRAHNRFFIECLDFYIDYYAEPDEFSGRFGARVLSALQMVEPYLVA